MKKINSPKFDSYKNTFVLMFLLFLTGNIIALILRKKDLLECLYPIFEYCKVQLDSDFMRGFVISLFELIFPFMLFIFGVTVYSPAVCVITVMSYPLLLTSKTAAASRISGAYAVFELFFSTVFGYILIIYSSLLFLLSVKIFTPKKDDKLFSGLLFSAVGIKRCFNYRFLTTYILFFIFVLIFSAIIIFVKCFLQSIL